MFGPQMGPKGPGRASIGFKDGLRFIWTKFQPKWAHLGPNGAPFYFSISQKPMLGPNSSKSNLGPGPIGPRAPSNMGSRAHGGRRPTFGRGVGGRSPPTATRGVWAVSWECGIATATLSYSVANQISSCACCQYSVLLSQVSASSDFSHFSAFWHGTPDISDNLDLGQLSS